MIMRFTLLALTCLPLTGCVCDPGVGSIESPAKIPEKPGTYALPQTWVAVLHPAHTRSHEARVFKQEVNGIHVADDGVWLCGLRRHGQWACFVLVSTEFLRRPHLPDTTAILACNTLAEVRSVLGTATRPGTNAWGDNDVWHGRDGFGLFSVSESGRIEVLNAQVDYSWSCTGDTPPSIKLDEIQVWRGTLQELDPKNASPILSPRRTPED
jgi:hypothetical protein